MEPDAERQADYSYWLKVRIWDSKEAAALLLGYEPSYPWNYYFDKVDAEVFKTGEKEDLQRSAIKREVCKLETILQSAQLAGELGNVRLNRGGGVWGNTVSPFDWMAWAKRNNIDCVEELLNAVAELKEQEDSEPNDIHPRRETTLLRIIGALLHILKENTHKSEASIIRHIDDLFGHIPGTGKSTVEGVFADAKRRLIEY